jgi:hypothetical protein
VITPITILEPVDAYALYGKSNKLDTAHNESWAALFGVVVYTCKE